MSAEKTLRFSRVENSNLSSSYHHHHHQRCTTAPTQSPPRSALLSDHLSCPYSPTTSSLGMAVLLPHCRLSSRHNWRRTKPFMLPSPPPDKRNWQRNNISCMARWLFITISNPSLSSITATLLVQDTSITVISLSEISSLHPDPLILRTATYTIQLISCTLIMAQTVLFQHRCSNRSLLSLTPFRRMVLQ